MSGVKSIMSWISDDVRNGNHKDWFATWATLIIALILIVYPTTRFVVEGTRSLYFLILILLSFVALAMRWPSFRSLKLERIEKFFLFCFFLMFAVTALSAFVAGGDGDEWKKTAIYTGFLFTVPVYLLFRLYMPSSRVVWLALVVACYVVAIRAWLEVNAYVEDYVWASHGVDRANGTMHPIRFGNLTLLLGFLSLAGTLYIKDIKIWLRVLGGVAFFCGLFASILSGSRGGWIAFPALFVIVLWPMFRDLQFKNKAIFIGVIFSGVLLIYNAPLLNIDKRIDAAFSDIERYKNEGDSKTSLGARFDMYETGFYMFKENPLFGVGIGRYREHALVYYNTHKDRLAWDVVLWGNPHNEILLHMATRGVVGLFVIAALFFVGIYFFTRHFRAYDKNTQFYAVSGLIVFVGYLHFGMSIALFEHRDFTLFFVIYVTLFMAGVNKESGVVIDSGATKKNDSQRL